MHALSWMEILLLLLITGVVFVNGWTDAPGAITCAVATGAMPYRKAVRLAALCNLAGILVTGLIGSAVADTISGMVRISPENPNTSIAVLCAAMLAIVIFAVTAWVFGIPTSESHALIAAVTGAALAQGIPGAVDTGAWKKVMAGLVLSLVFGFLVGFVFTVLLRRPLLKARGRQLDHILAASSASMAFVHGAQDGQKFLAVYWMAGCILRGVEVTPPGHLRDHPALMLLVAAVMALGTMAGGRRIITHVGEKMVALEKRDGVCADLGGALCLLLMTAAGIPVSTTHTKTAAIMGTGAASRSTKPDLGVIRGMLVAWGITFPVCGMIGWLVARVLLQLF